MATYRRVNRARSRRTRRRCHQPALLEPSFEAGVFVEPKLVFGGHHTHIDPKTGLALHGPYSLGREDQIPLRSITVGVVGTPNLVFKMNNWLRNCQAQVTNDGSEPFWRPAFPGINENTCFQCNIVFGETWQETIDPDHLTRTLQIANYWNQLLGVVELYTNAIARMIQREPRPTVIVCITPEEIDESLDTLSTQVGAMVRIRVPEGDSDDTEEIEGDEDQPEPETNPMSSLPFNVRRALKAAFMQFDIPTQLVRGSTLGQTFVGLRRHQQDDATKAWNLIAGLYYKAGSHLWRLADVQPGTCYVGISFYRERLESQPGMRTSLAQIFTHTGDGLVLRGNSFRWDRSQGPSPHLPEDLAEQLLTDAIAKYTNHSHGIPPTRLVLHKSSRFEDAERRGFEKAISGAIPQWDFVAMEKRGIQFLRQGDRAALRGTWVRLEEGDYILYTRGYIPFLRIYPGMRVPQPLEIIEHIGKSPADFILTEILALTKMNWNSADFSCEEPITLNFSRRVGEILALIPKGAPMREEYRYYM